MSDINPNCDGACCIKPTGQTRLYPTGGGGNMIFCFECWAHENQYRYNRTNTENLDADAFPQQNWWDAKIYEPCDHEWHEDEYHIEVCKHCGVERGE